MKSMRAAYEEYRALYAPMIETGSMTEAVMRGAFSAGVVYGLGIARLSPAEAAAAMDRMSSQLEEFWERLVDEGKP